MSTARQACDMVAGVKEKRNGGGGEGEDIVSDRSKHRAKLESVNVHIWL